MRQLNLRDRKLDELIDLLMQRRCSQRIFPGEQGYVSTAARLVASEINNWFNSCNVNYTVGFPTARSWLTKSCPVWVMAVLSQRLS